MAAVTAHNIQQQGRERKGEKGKRKKERSREGNDKQKGGCKDSQKRKGRDEEDMERTKGK